MTPNNLIADFLRDGTIAPGISARDKSALLDAAACEVRKHAVIGHNCSTAAQIEEEATKILDLFAKSKELEKRIRAKKTASAAPASTAHDVISSAFRQGFRDHQATARKVAGAFCDALSGKATAKPAPSILEQMADISKSGDMNAATAYYQKNQKQIRAAQAADITAANLKAVSSKIK